MYENPPKRCQVFMSFLALTSKDVDEKRVEWVGKGNDKRIVKDNSFKLFICYCIEMRVYILLVLNIESQQIVFKSAS